MEQSKQLFNKLGISGYRHFKILEKNNIRKCMVTLKNAEISRHIFGEKLTIIKGKATRQSPNEIWSIPLVLITETILDLHSPLELLIDYICVKTIPIVHLISSTYKFLTIETVRDKPKHNRQTTIKPIENVVNVYTVRGLQVSQINADNEFECIWEYMRKIKGSTWVASRDPTEQ